MWCPVAQDFARPFYKSRRWERCRAAYLMEPLSSPRGMVPPGMCERCFRMGELRPAKVVHHKVHLTPQNIDDPDVSLNYDNLQRLCQDCHAFVHSGQDEPRVTFESDGSMKPVDESLAAMLERATTPPSENRNIYRREA